MAIPTTTEDNYYQPPLIPKDNRRYPICSIDLQVVTKIDGWSQSSAKRTQEYNEIKRLGANYVTLGMPYDKGSKWINYANEAHAMGFKVIYRSQWNAWEKQNSSVDTMSKERYLDETYDFIVNSVNAPGGTWFRPGDLFAMCVEPNNANDHTNYTFRTPENSGGSFTISKYNQFLKDQIKYANEAFKVIGLGGQIGTWPISPSLSLMNLKGQILDSGDGGNSSGFGNDDVVKYFGGYLSIDHYLSASYRNGTIYANRMSEDLDKIHLAFPSCKIILNEWGYHTESSVTDAEQAEVFKKVTDMWKTKDYIAGVSFWVHMGSSTASIWNDSSGTMVNGGRPATDSIKNLFIT